MRLSTTSGRLWTDVAAAVAASVTGSLAVFMVGSLAVQLRQSLDFGPAELGWAVAAYYFGAAASSIALGRLAERIGGLRVMRLACAVSGVLLTGLAVVVRSWEALVVVLFFAGIASAAMLPATNLFLSRRIPSERQGTAFGVKQAAVPVSTLLAGLAVPALGLTVGWQWAFAAAAAFAFAACIALPRSRTSLASRLRRQAGDRVGPGLPAHLVILGVGMGLGIASSGALNGFLVSSAVASGVGRGWAGLLASLGGATAALARAGAGIRADRRGGEHLRVVSLLLALGAGGYGVLALSSARNLPALFVPGTMLAFGAGWGWNGLFTLAVVRAHRDHPARATAITQTGARLGGVVGPFIFGLLVSSASYATAWLATAAMAVTGSAVVLVGRHLISEVSGSGQTGPIPDAANAARGVAD